MVFLTKPLVNFHLNYICRDNFTGPGTRLDRRLNPDLTPKEWSKPINRVDTAAYRHDLCYAKHQDTKKTRNDVCDRQMVRELDEITNPTLRTLERGLVRNLINTKANFGLGI